jgi:septum site-determining protein MinC
MKWNEAMPGDLGETALFELTVLRPVAPVAAWLAGLRTRVADGWHPGAAVLDLSAAPLHGPGLRAVLTGLATLGIRVVGLSDTMAGDGGGAPAWLPPLLRPSPARVAPGLVHARGLRSGQMLRHAGDVTVIGPVASGAEVVSGGSIHIYGRLAGRALCELTEGRIFCRHLDAELLGIGGMCLTAEELPPGVTGRPAMAWCDGERLEFAIMAA